MAQAGGPGLLAPGDEMAFAIPRITPSDGGGVALPRPLPPSEAAQIRRIFALQQHGDIPAALRETARLDASTPLGQGMLGHLLADRYLGPYTRPDAAQLRDWLDRWPDLPDARAIHNLLVVRLPRGETAPPLPDGVIASDDLRGTPVAEESEPETMALPRDPGLDQAVWAAARQRGPESVERLLSRRGGVAPPYAAQLRGEAARILFTLNRDEDALRLASAGVHGCGPGPATSCARAALAGFVGGLAAWRLQKFDVARTMFHAAWRSDVTTPALQAAAAYWVARTHFHASDISGALPWLKRAAERRRTFYGLLARRTLGWPIGVSRVGPGERETLGVADIDAVAGTAWGLRAFALLQVDQPERAAAELRAMWSRARASRPLARALMLVADQAGLMDLAAQFADLLAVADGRPREGLRFPLPHLRPAHGFLVDPAMIYGVARAESDFDPDLVSSAGALGLLQIMPETAKSIERGASAASLRDPAINLDLGQRYMDYLAGLDVVGGNLIRLLAAYNAGPGNFAHWSSQISDNGDPLLFMEAIPIDETRAYVPRVLTYTWMYAARLHMPAAGLDDLAASRWPRYRSFDAGWRVASSSYVN